MLLKAFCLRERNFKATDHHRFAFGRRFMRGGIHHKAVIMITAIVITHLDCLSSLQHARSVSMCGADYEATPIHDNLIQRLMMTRHTHNCIQYRLPPLLVVTARPVFMCDADYEASPIHGNLIQWPMTVFHNHNYENDVCMLHIDKVFVGYLKTGVHGPKNTLSPFQSRFVTIPWRILTTVATLNDSPKMFMYGAHVRTQVRRRDDGQEVQVSKSHLHNTKAQAFSIRIVELNIRKLRGVPDGPKQPSARKRWVSDRTVTLLKSRRRIPASPEHNPVRGFIRCQVKMSVQADREVWWTQKAQEMEEAQKAGNARRLFHLLRDDEIMRRTLEGLQNPGVQIASDENLVDLECADDIVLVFEKVEKAQTVLDALMK
ncbi:ATP-binding cassette transporter, partial [Clonorchis sinensis]